jgi:flavin reductase (DIM6/NTAB) family NADH-FMN oxidoreductase RutF
VSVSASDLERPVLAFSLKGGSEMEGHLDAGSAVWVNLLNSGQENIARFFSMKRVDEEGFLECTGQKVSLFGSIGHFETEVISKVVVSESVFFFCRVLSVDLKNMTFKPLTYYSRNFNC